MTVPTIQPKRHHYIPQMVLRHFADTDGDLWFWRRDFKPGDIRKATTQNLFVQKDLYTQVHSDGTKDVGLEKFFAYLEGTGADFIRQLSAIVRRGLVPKLDDGAWDFWHHFFYYQIKRTPGYFKALAERAGFRESVRAGVEKLKEIEAAEGRFDGHESLESRIYKNAAVIAQGSAPTAEVLSVFNKLGLAIYRITDPAKSFIVADVPGAAARIGQPEDTVSGAAIFIPLTDDIAIGHLARPKAIEVFIVDREQVRRMNVASASRSTVIAGRSSALLASLSRSVPYVGVKGFDAAGRLETD